MSPANPSPAPVWDVINGYAAYGTLAAAVELGLFDAVHEVGEGGVDATRLAALVGARDPDRVALVADTLVALGFLTCGAGGYALTPVARRFLVSDSESSMAALVRLSPGPPQAWAELAGTVRRGVSTTRVDDDPASFYPELVAATAPTQHAVATAVVGELLRRGLLAEAPKVLDLGAGSGAWAGAVLDRVPSATAVAVDLPEVLPTTARLTSRHGERLQLFGGDYLALDLPAADLVFLCHVLRAEPAGRARRLLQRAIELAGPTGTVVVADYPRPAPATTVEPDAACRAARHELLLSMTMLAATAGAGITERSLRDWATQAGAALVDHLEPLPRQHVFLIRSDAAQEQGSDKENAS